MTTVDRLREIRAQIDTAIQTLAPIEDLLAALEIPVAELEGLPDARPQTFAPFLGREDPAVSAILASAAAVPGIE